MSYLKHSQWTLAETRTYCTSPTAAGPQNATEPPLESE